MQQATPAAPLLAPALPTSPLAAHAEEVFERTSPYDGEGFRNHCRRLFLLTELLMNATQYHRDNTTRHTVYRCALVYEHGDSDPVVIAGESFGQVRGCISAVFLCISLLAAACGPADRCGDTFEEPGVICLSEAVRTYWGFAPETLLVEDLDSDDFLDVVTANHARGTITALWGNSTTAPFLDGTATTWSVAPEVAGLVVNDLDGDGTLDVATAIPNTGEVAVLHGRGGRSLESARRIVVGAGPRALLAVDLDNTTPAELISINADDGSITVIRRLAVASRTVVGFGPRAAAAADFDGDADLDLAVSLAEGNAIQILLGDGTGTLDLGPLYPINGVPYGLVAEDFDVDGAIDLAVADALSDEVMVFFGDGAAGVRSQTNFQTAPDPRDIVVLHTIEAPPALAVLSHGASSVQRIEPTLNSQIMGTPSVWANTVTAADFDRDGVEDVLYASSSHGQVGILRPGSGIQRTPQWQSFPVDQAFPADLDGDGIDELATAVDDDNVRPSGLVLLREGKPIAEVDTGLNEPVRGVQVVDLAGDARRDLVVWGITEIAVLTQGGDGSFSMSGKYTVPESAIDLAFAGIEGDTGAELVVASSTAQMSRLRTFASDASGQLNVVSDVLIDGKLRTLTTLDYDDDSNTDLIILKDGELGVLNDVGHDPVPRWSELAAVSAPNALITAPVGLPGALDVLVCTNAELLIIAMISGIVDGEPERLNSQGCDALALSDVDADGDMDILVQRQEIAGRAVRTVITPWINTDDRWSPRASQSVPAEPITRFARFDADGIPDLILAGPERLTEASIMTFGQALEASWPTRIGADLEVRFGDLNQDGASDVFAYGKGLAVAFADKRGGFRPMEHHTLESMWPGAWSVGSAVLADFDGDGFDEIVLSTQYEHDRRAEVFSLAITADHAMEARSISVLPRGDVKLAAARFNTDELVDLIALAGRPKMDAVLFYGNDSAGLSLSERGESSVPDSLSESRFFDMDGDGLVDLLGLTETSGITIGAGTGTVIFEPWRKWSEVSGIRNVAAGHIDGDNFMDLLALSKDGVLSLRGTGAVSDGRPHLLLKNVTAISFAELDQDGSGEILAIGPETNVKSGSILRIGSPASDGSYAFIEHSVDITDVTSIEVAEFDGDGHPDIAVIGGGTIAIVRQTP